MKVRAHAKINLSLKILGRRPDGFHDIESLMTEIRLSDELDYLPGKEALSLSCSDPAIPVDNSNLVLRAAHAFSEHTGIKVRGRIHLEKNIPSGAGLGGGSADAAATLKMLNQTFDTHLDNRILEELGGELGSDIPFFVTGKPAICRGRGEILEQAPSPPLWRIALFKPPFGIATPEAYGLWSPEAPKSEPQLLDEIPLFNDFEPVVFDKYLLLPVLKNWLHQQTGVRAALMSGSGSTLFAVLDKEADTRHLFEEARSLFGPSLWTAESHTCQSSL